MKKIFALLLIAVAFSGCEKDDICVDETTPRLIIEFYDVSNPANLKNVFNLTAKADDAANPIVFNSTLLETDPARFLFNGNKLELPLKTDIVDGQSTLTRYHLVLNSTSSAANEDILEFRYTAQNVFVSRACGYKTIFQLNSPGGVLSLPAVAPDIQWIKQANINIQKYSIVTEDETHIKIYF